MNRLNFISFDCSIFYKSWEVTLNDSILGVAYLPVSLFAMLPFRWNAPSSKLALLLICACLFALSKIHPSAYFKFCLRALRQTRTFANSRFRRFAISPFRHFADSPFRHFAISRIRRFADSQFRHFADSPFRHFDISPFRLISFYYVPFRELSLCSVPVSLICRFAHSFFRWLTGDFPAPMCLFSNG